MSNQATTALLVQAEAAPGAAAAGNGEAANVLVVVTEFATGRAVTDLKQTDFTIINHLSFPGQTGGFSNGIAQFNNVGTGAYHLLVKLAKGGKWASGGYLAQIMVSAGERQGQATALLMIR